MKIDFEYGHGLWQEIFRIVIQMFLYQVLRTDPPHIPFDKLVEETRKSILNLWVCLNF